MFVRKRKNKSGSTSIQIIDKSSGKFSLVEHIGTSSVPSEIESLLQYAKDKIPVIQQKLSLFHFTPNTSHTLQHMKTIWIGYKYVFGSLFRSIGYHQLLHDELLEYLVIARIVYPESKQSITRWLSRKFDITLSKNKLYRLMDKLDDTVERNVVDQTFHFAKTILGKEINIIFFDATTLHFETFGSDTLRKPGFSKVGKHNQPQIVIGLMVTEEGLPIGYDVYPGNQFDGHTIRSALRRVSRRYNVSDVVFIADNAMMSKNNVKLLEDNGFKYIMAASIKNMPHAMKDKILDTGNYKKDIFDTEYTKNQRLVVSYSPDRARKDKVDREKNIQQIKKRLTRKSKISKSKLGKIGKSKYLMVDGEAEVSIDYETIRADAEWDGLKGYFTNIPRKLLSAHEVIQKYSELWQVEKAFRVSKSDLQMRPIYHYKRERIRAHILLVFMSLFIARYFEYIMQPKKITLKRALEHLEGDQLLYMKDTQTRREYVVRSELSSVMQDIYATLNIS